MDIRRLSALELGEKIKKREISSPEAVEEYLRAIQEEDAAINAYITVFREEALRDAREAQKGIESGELTSPLAGVPVAVKDNICVRDRLTTSASRMLENFRPPYDAHVVEKFKAAGAVIIGKTNLDEFAMGSSTETSYYGITKNPWDAERVPGGSSGGSAAAVAAGLAPYAIGSDTGGSIRQPCAFCNLTGVKPTYGSVSRYGLMAFASSLDQIGPMARDAMDCAAALELISGPDGRDSTSLMKKPFRFAGEAADIKGLRIGVPENYFEMGIADEVKTAVLKAAEVMKSLGAEVSEFELPMIEYAAPAYYVIACAEASSNLSRYDGVKYGYRSKDAADMTEMFYKSRSEGLGTEVKRRVMIGSFVLSSGYFDAYYKKALQVRGLIKKSFDEAFQRYDMVLSPVSPTVAYHIGRKTSDPVAMYMSDIYTVSVNLAGLPGVALPCGFDGDNMPIGMQFIGRAFSDDALIGAAAAYQKVTDYHRQRPSAFEKDSSLHAAARTDGGVSRGKGGGE